MTIRKLPSSSTNTLRRCLAAGTTRQRDGGMSSVCNERSVVLHQSEAWDKVTDKRMDYVVCTGFLDLSANLDYRPTNNLSQAILPSVPRDWPRKFLRTFLQTSKPFRLPCCSHAYPICKV